MLTDHFPLKKMPFPSKDDLANAALNILGEPDATPFTGGTSTRDTSIRRHYDSALEHVLTMFRWDFATKFPKLILADPQPDDVPPVFPHAYDLPTDCLRVQTITTEAGLLVTQFQLAGTYIFLDTDEHDDSSVLQYTTNDIEPSAMPTVFSDCLVYELAKRIAPMLTQSPQLLEQMNALHSQAFAKATTAEARQTTSGENTSPLALARNSGLFRARFSI